MYIQSCTMTTTTTLEGFRHPKGDSVLTSLLCAAPQPLAPTVCFPSLDLPVLDTSQKWSHTLYDLLCLVSPTERDFFKYIGGAACTGAFPAMAEHCPPSGGAAARLSVSQWTPGFCPC